MQNESKVNENLYITKDVTLCVMLYLGGRNSQNKMDIYKEIPTPSLYLAADKCQAILLGVGD